MSKFCRWFNRTSPLGAEPLPAITRAGIGLLYFGSILPFETGNAQIGRAIAEKSLMQSFSLPWLISLSPTILAQEWDLANCTQESRASTAVTDWLMHFAEIVLGAQRRTVAQVDFLVDKTKVLDRLQGQINERQQKAIRQMFDAGPDGFKGGLSACDYISITGASPATTTRDLVDLTNQGVLIRAGKRKIARYSLSRSY